MPPVTAKTTTKPKNNNNKKQTNKNSNKQNTKTNQPANQPTNQPDKTKKTKTPRLDLSLFAPSAGTGGTNEANDGRVPVDPSVVGGSVHPGRPFVPRPRLAVLAAHQLPSPRALSGTLVVRTDSVVLLSGCMPTDSMVLLIGCMPTDSVVLLSGCMPIY